MKYNYIKCSVNSTNDAGRLGKKKQETIKGSKQKIITKVVAIQLY